MTDILADERARAALEKAGAAHGLVDPDALRLADLADVSIGDDGLVTGASEAIAKLKEGKPYLFKQRTARDMSPQERIVALRKIIADADRAGRGSAPPAAKSAQDMTERERTDWLKQHRAAHR
jgi:hypothetical protein